MLDEAEGPESSHGKETCDSPAPSPEGWTSRSDFAADEAEEGGSDEGYEKNEEEDGFEDEDEGAGIPVWIEGKEGPQAVVVGPVEKEMA